jgi:hypothetical protein
MGSIFSRLIGSVKRCLGCAGHQPDHHEAVRTVLEPAAQSLRNELPDLLVPDGGIEPRASGAALAQLADQRQICLSRDTVPDTAPFAVRAT